MKVRTPANTDVEVKFYKVFNDYKVWKTSDKSSLCDIQIFVILSQLH